MTLIQAVALLDSLGAISSHYLHLYTYYHAMGDTKQATRYHREWLKVELRSDNLHLAIQDYLLNHR